MHSGRMTLRFWIVAAILLGSTLCLHAMSHGEATVARQPLQNLPYLVGNWMGQEVPLDQDVLKAVGVTDYVNRNYFSSSEMPVQLYVGYYASQRTGDTIHSPKNCLPGSGWDPIRSGYATIPLADRGTAKVNEYIIAQGLNRQLVFYWYEGRGRIIASEYWGKFWMIDDAIMRNRTDGALVRVITPIKGEDISQAHDCLEKFTHDLLPILNKFIPS